MASARSLHTFNRGKQVNCSLHAGLSICRKPQKCRLWTSTQYRNCPSKRTDKKAKQKQQSKNRKNTQPKQNQTKTTERSGIATSNGNYMHNDILCVILRMAQNKKQNRTNTKHTKGPRWWVREATKPSIVMKSLALKSGSCTFKAPCMSFIDCKLAGEIPSRSNAPNECQSARAVPVVSHG